MNDIDLAKSIIKEIDCGYISYGNLHNNQDEGLKLIKAALEKQIIPKKLKQVSSHFECECGTWILFDDEIPNENDSFCPRCGQKIDWREE